MKALLDFTGYATDAERASTWNYLMRLAEVAMWNLRGYPRSVPQWTPEFPYILAYTTSKVVIESDGSDTYDATYNALTQLTTIVNAIRTNTRATATYANHLWSFDSNGDVYIDRTKIDSATFDTIIAARAAVKI